MERELWPPLYRLLRDTAKDFRQKYVQHQPWVLLAVMLWAALHDRPVSWACRRRHWSTTALRPWRLPSPATMSRRIDGAGLALLWRAVEQRLRDSGTPALIAVVDGKPLPVGGNRKDPDARFGRGAGCIAKGYKLHAAWSTRSVPEAWEVTPLNGNEKAVAAALVGRLGHGGYLLGDGNYDASYLYDAAARRGYQLVAPFRKGKEPGSGKHYQSPHRLRGIAILRGAFGAALYRARTAIERSFGNATSFAGGLGPLPAWVRGLERVRTWVWAKLLINAVRIRRTRTYAHP
jgi:Transposase DDE domain